MPIEHKRGDIFQFGERVLAHGCNCLGLMGAGIAKEIAARFPIALHKNKIAVKAGVFVPGYAQFVVDEENDQCIYNLATQLQPGRVASEPRLDYCYLAFANMLNHAMRNRISRIAIPRIGAGIAGLQWEDVESMLDHAFGVTHTENEITVVVYTP